MNRSDLADICEDIHSSGLTYLAIKYLTAMAQSSYEQLENREREYRASLRAIKAINSNSRHKDDSIDALCDSIYSLKGVQTE